MYGLANIYTGCKCGETWNVSTGQTEDVERDEVYHFDYCTVCGGTNLTQKFENGLPCMHEITEEEHRVLSGFYRPDIEMYDDIDESEFNPCSRCDGHPACEETGCAFFLGLGHLVQNDDLPF